MRQSRTWLKVLVLLLIGNGAASAQDVLKWTDDTGKFEFVAAFCGVKDGKVFLDDKKGKVIQVPIGKLSVSSRAQAKSLFDRMPTIAGSGETLCLSKDRPAAFDMPYLPVPKEADIEPRFDRWVIQIKASNSSEMAALLDAFQLEIGVIGGTVKGLQIVSQLSAARPTVVTELSVEKEVRLYYMHVGQNEILNMQRELAARAGIQTEGRTILTFVSGSLENVLAHVEMQHGKEHGANSISMIKKTTFEISFKGAQPTLTLLDMKSKNGPSSDQ